MNRSLYEEDILLWVEETVSQLKAGDFEHLDLEHLIEEIEALGISQKRELLSRLVVLLEHLLKRLYVDLPYDYNGWERTIRTQRTELDILLSQVPSLKKLWQKSFAEAWRRALVNVKSEYKSVSFPDEWPYAPDWETTLTVNFWASHHTIPPQSKINSTVEELGSSYPRVTFPVLNLPVAIGGKNAGP